MKLLSWNARGLGNPRGIYALSELIRKEDLEVLFLQETKLNTTKMEFCRIKMKFYGCFNVESVGRSGGLTILWKPDVHLTILSYSKSHIDAKIESLLHSWFLTGIYGHPDTNKCIETWNLIRSMKRDPLEPWLVFDDFNEILSNEEKWGGCDRPRQQLESFQQMFFDCELRDLGFKGPHYTWNNGRYDSAQIFERLERFTGNASWCQLFSEATVTHGSTAYSDHQPIWVQLYGAHQTPKGPKPFHFESMRIGEKACTDIILDNWSDSSPQGLDNIMENIRCCSNQLQSWNVSKFEVQVQVQVQLSNAKTKLA
ncbi:uncharacterized protein LOC111375728 [Olea europaea var. sylvestris]|uniref:uncharacterized protein LOC111375728 n=1 Tax=Olea europaea var. sylvestris TaxID=158386 RepID=UPI000C1CDEFD|nr:uncharacterized protein LOC111375728 [Olea europaea var. sylvestris]